MKIKICGMKSPDNIMSVAALQPDYLGFIFFKRSKRNFESVIPQFDESIKKVGVFVNERLSLVLDTIEKHNLDAVQLHGDESEIYCHELKEKSHEGLELIKAFSISKGFNFDILKNFTVSCDFFLFDTKGKERGGNGILFDWNILNNYKLEKPFFLSGGIGLEECEVVKEFLTTKAAAYCYAIDVNSKFESEPGLKKIEDLKEFLSYLENTGLKE